MKLWKNKMDKMMNPILEVMKKRIQPLISLTIKANKQIDKAQENGYEVNIECWSSSGYRGTTNDIRLIKFSKDLVKSEGNTMTPTAIKKTFDKVTEELKQLEKEQYCLEVTGQRPNRHNALFIEKVWMILTDDDISQGYNLL